jgi:hypothetical protein
MFATNIIDFKKQNNLCRPNFYVQRIRITPDMET